jgi:hypothetical protein
VPLAFTFRRPNTTNPNTRARPDPDVVPSSSLQPGLSPPLPAYALAQAAGWHPTHPACRSVQKHADLSLRFMTACHPGMTIDARHYVPDSDSSSGRP